jgi:hypothetical protein
MNRIFIRNFSLVLIILLSACASVGQSATPTPVGTGIISQLKTDYANALSPLDQLAVGTLKLDGTANAIDKAEAAELLPLWKVLRLLSSSNTAAVEEINAAIRQIGQTMKPEQVNAIAAMQLTSQDMAAVFSSGGLAFGPGGGGSGTLTPEQQATRQALRQGGGGGGGFQGGGGGFPGGGGGFPGGGGGGGQGAQQTAVARVSSSRITTGIDLRAVNVVITFLESK